MDHFAGGGGDGAAVLLLLLLRLFSSCKYSLLFYPPLFYSADPFNIHSLFKKENLIRLYLTFKT